MWNFAYNSDHREYFLIVSTDDNEYNLLRFLHMITS